jgi:hypothetical protein
MGDSNYCLVELIPRDSFTGWLCALVGNECEIHVPSQVWQNWRAHNHSAPTQADLPLL